MFLIRLGGSIMRKPTGQMQEQTQKYLDDYNSSITKEHPYEKTYRTNARRDTGTS